MIAPPFQFLEFFAGGGMARLGLADHFECIFANDIDPAKCTSYRANFGHGDLFSHLHETDVAALNPAQIPNAAMAWASFPCQDLSLAGNRGGLRATRSGVFWTFWQLMETLAQSDQCPPLIVMENVTGLLSSNGGEDFANLVNTVARAGYSIGGVIIDAVDFTPQSRPRLFLIASRLQPPDDLTAASPGHFHTSPLRTAVDRLDPASRKAWVWWKLPEAPRRNTSLVDIIDRTPPGSVWRSQAKLDHCLSLMTPEHRARVAAAVATPDVQVGAVYRRIRNGQQRAEVRYDGLAGCLRTLKGGSSRQLLLISEGGKLGLRPLLPREAARLMGLPEQFQLPKSATAAMNLIGDGVSVPAVKWLSTNLLFPLARDSHKNWHRHPPHRFESHLARR